MKRAIILAVLLVTTVAVPASAQESYTVEQLQQRCLESDVPGLDDPAGICLTVLSLMLFPELDLELPELSGGSNAGDAAVSHSGSGDKITGPFNLSGGDYRVDINQRGDCDIGAWWVRTAADGHSVESFDKSGFMYAVDGGRHYIEVITVDRCSWSMTISPL